MVCRNIVTISVAISCLSILVLAGCITVSEMFHGDEVSADRVVTILKDGLHTDSMQTFDIMIDYEFVRNEGVLHISGQAALTNRYPLLYGGLSYLETYLFFVDDTNRVLETVSLAYAAPGDLAQRLVFEKSLNIPTAAVGISFGYRGSVREGDSGRSETYDFDLLPRQR